MCNKDGTSFSSDFFTGVVGEASNDVSEMSSINKFDNMVESEGGCIMLSGLVMMWSGRLIDDGIVVSGVSGFEAGIWLLLVPVLFET